MLRKIVVLLVMMCMHCGNVYANDDYPYKSICPDGGESVDDFTNWFCGDNGCFYKDRWNFAQCECTSYSAYKMDDELFALADIHFNNSYFNQHWGNGNHWDNAARAAGIKVDSTPIPGDIAYWETPSSTGHVAFVESVEYDNQMNAITISISEYNYPSGSNGGVYHDYGTRTISPSNPSGYIHIMAHQECATSYYFNRMDAQWSFPEQTQEEWEKIFLLVWDKYRESNDNCSGNSQVAFQQLWDAYGGLPSGFGGGGNGNGAGPGYDDDTGDDNWAGYAHHVGLKYMKVGKKSSGNWDGSVTWALNEIPSKRDFRIKLKQKGGIWPDGDTCAEVWFSHNKNFTNGDLYLKQKCKDLSDETEDERSIYVKDVNIPNMEAGKNYYFFTRVTYSGGVNPSSDDDHDEYVKVDVTEENNNGQGDAQWQSFSDAKKAAIMSIIFD